MIVFIDACIFCVFLSGGETKSPRQVAPPHATIAIADSAF